MLAYPTLPGDVDHLLAVDHAVVARQFERLEAGEGDRLVLVDQIAFELSLHATAEERVVYPAMLAAGLRDVVSASRDEHQEMKELLVAIGRGKPGDAEFESALSRLMAAVRHHAHEEEQQHLPALREAVGAERMAELGKELLAAKRAAPSRAHRHAPATGAGHALADRAAQLLDRARDLASGRIDGLATDPSHVLDAQAQRLLDAFSALHPQPLEILEPEQARRQPTLVDAVRKVLHDTGRSTDPEPVGSVEDIEIDGPAGPLTVRVYRPVAAPVDPLPMLLWIHGGGWVLFDIDTYDASCRGLTNKTGAVVVSPDYRRAPEHVFPAAHDDVLATYRWMRDEAARLGGDPERIAIGGESVGGNMAAATCLTLAELGEPGPLFQVLVYPLTTAEEFGDSMRTEADARPLNLPLLAWMAAHAFEGAPDGAKDPRVALLDLSPEQLRRLPAALVITDQRDILRDQGEEFARRLRDAGVPVTATRYDGVMHEFFGAAAVLDQAERAQLEAADHLRRAFTVRSM